MRVTLGTIVSTMGAKMSCSYPRACTLLMQHQKAEWGHLSDDDKQRNDEALSEPGATIMSAWPIDPTKPCEPGGDNTIWIITDGPVGQRVTTILLPSEY